MFRKQFVTKFTDSGINNQEDEQMKSKDRMIRAIRSRKDLEPTVISLRKLLASGGMEHYLNLCSGSLADEFM